MQKRYSCVPISDWLNAWFDWIILLFYGRRFRNELTQAILNVTITLGKTWFRLWAGRGAVSNSCHQANFDFAPQHRCIMILCANMNLKTQTTKIRYKQIGSKNSANYSIMFYLLTFLWSSRWTINIYIIRVYYNHNLSRVNWLKVDL